VALRAAAISGPQIRAARVLLQWTVRDLARRAVVSIAEAAFWEESHGMVQSEYIDSRHSNTKLGTSSGRHHRNLAHLQIHYLSETRFKTGPGELRRLPVLMDGRPAVGRRWPP
jgi:hypothetical protein